MNCQIAQDSLSAHLDGCLSDRARREVLAHLGRCPDCDLRLRQLARVRAMVGKLPAAVPPAHLTSDLRVIASRERARTLARRSPLGYYHERLRLFVDNLMRPLALPFAGGLISALMLFSMLMPSIRQKHDPRLNDVPLMNQVYTDPTIKSQNPFEIDFTEALMVAVTVDSEGRAVDFGAPDGSTQKLNPDLRRKLQSELLFTEFTPATAYGRPTIGRLLLSFGTRTEINVPVLQVTLLDRSKS